MVRRIPKNLGIQKEVIINDNEGEKASYHPYKIIKASLNPRK